MSTTTTGYRVMIVEDETLVGIGLQRLLEKLNHRVVGQAATADEGEKLFDDLRPEMVLLDIRLDGSDGIDLAQKLLKKRRVPMIIISAYSDEELIKRASNAGVFGYLIKPVAIEALAAQIAVAVERFKAQEKLIEERDQLTLTLETRKLVDRAKGILMKRSNISEPDAHKRLQQESQKRRVSIAELARRIIESEEIMGGP